MVSMYASDPLLILGGTEHRVTCRTGPLEIHVDKDMILCMNFVMTRHLETMKVWWICVKTQHTHKKNLKYHKAGSGSSFLFSLSILD